MTTFTHISIAFASVLAAIARIVLIVIELMAYVDPRHVDVARVVEIGLSC